MKTTREAAAELGMEPATLRAHIGAGHIRPPVRRVGLAFLWTEEEVDAARKVLAVPGRRKPRYTQEALAGVAGEADQE